jgi:hypothetical protein
MSQLLQHLSIPSLSVAAISIPALTITLYRLVRPALLADLQPGVTPCRSKQNFWRTVRYTALFLTAVLVVGLGAVLLAKLSAPSAPASSAHEQGVILRVSLCPLVECSCSRQRNADSSYPVPYPLASVGRAPILS